MRHPKLALALLLSSLILAACADESATSAPTAVASAERVGVQEDREVEIYDNCDPPSFNEVLGPGTCIRALNGPRGMRYMTFIRVLTELQVVPAWEFEPENTTVNFGDVFHAENEGGETHTFTHVAQFGGGIVPELNDLSGNPIPAPECLTLDDDDFILPDSVYVEPADQRGQMHFQCCIHPWMRTTATVR
jgi:hypothetical protein